MEYQVKSAGIVTRESLMGMRITPRVFHQDYCFEVQKPSSKGAISNPLDWETLPKYIMRVESPPMQANLHVGSCRMSRTSLR